MRRSILTLAAAAVLACGGDTIQPQDRVLATGTYAYEGRWLHPGTLEWDTIQGELVVEAVTPDSLHGHWVMAGFVPDSTGGYWNENAYVLPATSSSGQITITNRLSRLGSPADLQCSLNFREERPQQDALTTSGSCDVDPMP